MRVSLQDNEERVAHNKEQIGEQLDFDFVQPNLDSRSLVCAFCTQFCTFVINLKSFII